jgi:DNA/RNA-binding domain of Phe-tRNA-synthetase-like protein
VDALSRRLGKVGALPRISPAVDAYNLISVTYGTPAGAFDLDSLATSIDIRFAHEGDSFVPLGQPDDRELLGTGEVVYAQGQQVLTRHWNHRDCDQAKVTPKSRNVVFIIERISRSAVTDATMIEAQARLAELTKPHAESVTLAVIDEERPRTRLETD